MTHFRIIEWETYQHYRDRSPPWIKLHRDTLASRTWVTASDSERVLAIACMLLAALHDNKIPADPGYIRRVAYLHEDPNLQRLADLQFIEFIDSQGNALADDSKKKAKRTKCLTRGETETETDRSSNGRVTELVPGFADFWGAYPRHTAKQEAIKAFTKLKPDAALLASILAAVHRAASTHDWQKDGGKFVPHPATWLNGRRWEDEPPRASSPDDIFAGVK